MSLGKANLSKIQLGNDATASNNFLLKIPASPNGTVVLANGNDGSETDLIAFNSTGNIVMNNGKGIDFSATANSSGTMTSELLNDYEEGTWTPSIDSSGGGAATGLTSSGSYTKIGNRVFVEGTATWTGHTGSGNFRVGGLPFTVASGVAHYGGMRVLDTTNISATAGYIAVIQAAQGTSQAFGNQVPVGGGSTLALPLDTAGTIYFNFDYQAA